jgi:hypothetical protein
MKMVLLYILYEVTFKRYQQNKSTNGEWLCVARRECIGADAYEACGCKDEEVFWRSVDITLKLIFGSIFGFCTKQQY